MNQPGLRRNVPHLRSRGVLRSRLSRRECSRGHYAARLNCRCSIHRAVYRWLTDALTGEGVAGGGLVWGCRVDNL